jgi:hypothetical protein
MQLENSQNGNFAKSGDGDTYAQHTRTCKVLGSFERGNSLFRYYFSLLFVFILYSSSYAVRILRASEKVDESEGRRCWIGK